MRVLHTLGRAFSTSRVAMAMVDLEGRWLEVNPALCELLGRPADELLGRSLMDVTHPEDVPASGVRMSALATHAHETTFQKRYVHADGRIIHAEVTSSVAVDEHGEPEAVFSQIIDVTARRAAAEQLRESEEAFARAFEDAPIGMSLTYGFEAGARIERVNEAFCQIFRATPEQIRAAAPHTLVHPDDLEASAVPWRQMVAGEVDRFSHEHRMIRFDGSVFWAYAHASMVRDADGNPLYAITQLMDVSERKEGEVGLRAAERRFRSAFDDAGTAMALMTLDWALLRVNRAMCDLLGRDHADLLGRDVRTLLHPDEVEVSEAHVRSLLGDGDESCTRDARWLHPDGPPISSRLTASLVRGDEGEPLYFIVQIADMTAEREARELAERRIAQQTAVAWLGQRALADPDLMALFEAAVGVAAATLGASHAGLGRLEEGDRLRLVAAVGWPTGGAIEVDATNSGAGFTLAGDRPVLVTDLEAETRFDPGRLLATGVRSGISCRVHGIGERPYGVLSIHSTEPHAFTADDCAFLTSLANVLTGAIRRDAAARDLRHQSLHDPLTSLPNRTLLLDRLRQGLARGRRDGSTVGVLFCDMDDFKYVNDSLGHDAGDRLLSALAPRLRQALRTTDTLARFGGDEFVVVCEGLHDAAEIVQVADRLLQACAQPVDLGGREFVPTASIGIAIAGPSSDVEPEALLRDADVAMYGAKSRGKGRYELFDARMRASTIERIALISDLRHAVSRDELELVFQPVVSLRRRQIAGLESLVRWRHPERGLLSPCDFIPIAEDNGLIHEVGGWVLHEAIRQAAAWQRARTPVLERTMVGINVSWRQISRPTLVDEVHAALDVHGLDPRFFCIEVTESALMEDRERSLETLQRLRGLGVHLALDDFGTGQSSLSVLREFPLHTLKLDRSFLAGEGEWAIVEAVCRMARSMDLMVVAEGVEEPRQAEQVDRLGCDFGQGWLYCRPKPADELEAKVLEVEAKLA